jgi:CsoR family transcriptional regulator, copper-sensing transcriptional repressor
VRGYTMTKEQYRSRLRRIEGQVRGVQRMIEEDTYCIDVLQQIAAVNGALQNVAIGLLDEHVGHCVANAAADGDADRAREMVTEATNAIARLVKS